MSLLHELIVKLYYYMITLTICSLAGGQGKTSSAYFVARMLASKYKVLLVDGDPQSSLTLYSRHQTKQDEPSLFEVLKGIVKPIDAVYQLGIPNIYLIPSDDGLDKIQQHLADSGMGGLMLRKYLKPLNDLFDFCIIDSPPQRSQLCISCMGAANKLLISCECTIKGVQSLLRTIDTISELKDIELLNGDILGVLPFKDVWVGANQTTTSKKAITLIKSTAMEENLKVFPSILQSERHKQAMDSSKTLSETGYKDLENPFIQVVEDLELCVLRK